MPLRLNRFVVEGLHGAFSVALRFSENRAILVGENGSGKTTVISMFYFLLTRQWRRLAGFKFTRLVLEVADHPPLEVRAEHVRAVLDKERAGDPGRFLTRLPTHALEEWYSAISKTPDDPVTYRRLQELGYRYNVPLHELYEPFLREMRRDEGRGVKKRHHAEVERISRQLEQLFRDIQILYLPTYRRIEQDLAAILPHFDHDRIKQAVHRDRTTGGFVEMVEFGMGDVEGAMSKKMSALKDLLRAALHDLSGSYLREIIRGVHKHIDSTQLQALSDTNVDPILDKIDSAILPEIEKETLRQIVLSVRIGLLLEPHQMVVAHYLLRLVEVHKRLESAETAVRRFVACVNAYLMDKAFEYDDVHFTLKVMASPGTGGGEILLKQLSSGEKQIVSLFAHVFLGEADRQHFIIIDEPEMSLSVIWQRRLLPDLLASGLVTGVAAVTHSPFIYDNELDGCAQALRN